jgi:WD40 repeat protein
LAAGRDFSGRHVFDVTTGKDTACQINIAGGPKAAYSADCRRIASLQNGQIAVHEVDDGAEVCRTEKLAAPDAVGLLALSPDGRTVAWVSGTGLLVHLLDVATGKERHTFAGHQGSVCSLAFSADGKKLVSGGADTTLLVWDMTAPQAAPGSGRPEKPISPRKAPTFHQPRPTTTAKGTQRE